MPGKKPKISVIPLREIPDSTPIKPRKGNLNPPTNTGLGGNTYSTKTYAPTFAQPRVKKQERGLDTWSNTAIILADRALKASQTYGKKDFNALYRLVLSAGIAYDKAFPSVQLPTGTNLIVQLFGSLGQDTAKAILEPQHPNVVDITPTPSSIPNEASEAIDTLPLVEPNTPTEKPLG